MMSDAKSYMEAVREMMMLTLETGYGSSHGSFLSEMADRMHARAIYENVTPYQIVNDCASMAGPIDGGSGAGGGRGGAPGGAGGKSGGGGGVGEGGLRGE